ncbi:MAG TPA: hypothetical protein VHW60_21300 [Caulobacteraceae bacterium]|jgi:hypothetical protein|nr:hypothetical protein [Caulobacteraceae bacterium]
MRAKRAIGCLFTLAALVVLAAPASSARPAQPHAANAHSGPSDQFDALCRNAPPIEERPDPAKAGVYECLLDALAFDPGVYFYETEQPGVAAAGGIVDAVFTNAIHGDAWGFAIDLSCLGTTTDSDACPAEKRRVLIRAVTFKPNPNAPSNWESEAFGTASGVRGFLGWRMDWREADVGACPGAADVLMSLQHLHWFSFSANDRENITGSQEHEPVVVSNGDSVLVRARGQTSGYLVVELPGYGKVADWAQKMMTTVEPCLKPTSAPIPWRVGRPAPPH